jgi:hypothetical protein
MHIPLRNATLILLDTPVALCNDSIHEHTGAHQKVRNPQARPQVAGQPVDGVSLGARNFAGMAQGCSLEGAAIMTKTFMALTLGVAGFALMWISAGFVPAFAVFLIMWGDNLDKTH